MDHYATAGQAQAKMDGRYAGQVEKERELESVELSNRLASAQHRASKIVERLSMFAERLMGPRPYPAPPTQNAANTITPNPQNFSAKISVSTATIACELDNVERLLSTLESFV